MTTSFLNDFDLGTCDLHVADVTKHYGDFSLAGVTLDVPRGSIVGLVGRNGAGKTTLMKIILGATLADAGHVELFGKDCATLDDAELAHLRERVGYVGATIAYPAGMRVRDVVRMYELSYPAFDRARSHVRSPERSPALRSLRKTSPQVYRREYSSPVHRRPRSLNPASSWLRSAT